MERPSVLLLLALALGAFEGGCSARLPCVESHDCLGGDPCDANEECLSRRCVGGACTTGCSPSVPCPDGLFCLANDLRDDTPRECFSQCAGAPHDEFGVVDYITLVCEDGRPARCEDLDAPLLHCSTCGGCGPGTYCDITRVRGDEGCAPTRDVGASCLTNAFCTSGNCLSDIESPFCLLAAGESCDAGTSLCANSCERVGTVDVCQQRCESSADCPTEQFCAVNADGHICRSRCTDGTCPNGQVCMPWSDPEAGGVQICVPV